MSNKVKLSFEKYDSLIEELREIDQFNRVPYWPAPSDIEKYANSLDVKKVVNLFIWLLETNGKPQDEQESISKKAIQKFLYDHLELGG